jgi:pimeloyl-ACP methyl ester carboxylesterase
VLLLAIFAIWVIVVRPRTNKLARAVPDEYNLPAVEGDSEGARNLRQHRKDRARAIASARVLAQMVDWLPGLLAVMTSFAVVGIGLVVGMYAVGGEAAFQRWVPGTTLAVTLISGTAGALVAAAVFAYRNRQARRTVGIIWDVVTFWPRANHPLTPPCYAERAVPELSRQLENHLAAGDTQRVIAATHSQGTIIGAATMLRLDEAVRQRTALLTFGSPLRRLYARNFPTYFGLTAMTQLHDVQPRWINMWVFSDPIGGWIFNDTNTNLAEATGLVDYRIPDAETLDPGPRDQTMPICAHSGYADRPEYGDVIEALESQLTTPQAAQTPDDG